MIIVFAAPGCKQKCKAFLTNTVSIKDTVTITNYLAGKQLFLSNCAACHAINKLAEPPQLLTGLENRWKDKALLYAFIRN